LRGCVGSSSVGGVGGLADDDASGEGGEDIIGKVPLSTASKRSRRRSCTGEARETVWILWKKSGKIDAVLSSARSCGGKGVPGGEAQIADIPPSARMMLGRDWTQATQRQAGRSSGNAHGDPRL
jgi:hypothetical protein